MIRDSEGEMSVPLDYAFDNPTLFKWVGMLDINDERINYFELE